MGLYDIPAALKFIYAKTSQKVSYIGHSQGTIQMHVALVNNQPVVESLLDKYFGFGPLIYVNHQTSKLMTMVANSKILEWFQNHNINNFLPEPTWY
jgi:gastric triacylglycerol lipase